VGHLPSLSVPEPADWWDRLASTSPRYIRLPDWTLCLESQNEYNVYHSLCSTLDYVVASHHLSSYSFGRHRKGNRYQGQLGTV